MRHSFSLFFLRERDNCADIHKPTSTTNQSHSTTTTFFIPISFSLFQNPPKIPIYFSFNPPFILIRTLILSIYIFLYPVLWFLYKSYNVELIGNRWELLIFSCHSYYLSQYKPHYVELHFIFSVYPSVPRLFLLYGTNIFLNSSTYSLTYRWN